LVSVLVSVQVQVLELGLVSVQVQVPELGNTIFFILAYSPFLIYGFHLTLTHFKSYVPPFS